MAISLPSPTLATGEPGGNDLLGLWRRLDAGDAGGVRQRLRALSARREGIRMLPGEVEILAAFMEAQLALAAGDTAWGTSRLAASRSARTANSRLG